MTTSVFKRVDYTLDQLLAGISLGTIGLPDIQRPFIWKPVRVRDRTCSTRCIRAIQLGTCCCGLTQAMKAPRPRRGGARTSRGGD